MESTLAGLAALLALLAPCAPCFIPCCLCPAVMTVGIWGAVILSSMTTWVILNVCERQGFFECYIAIGMCGGGCLCSIALCLRYWQRKDEATPPPNSTEKEKGDPFPNGPPQPQPVIYQSTPFRRPAGVGDPDKN